MSKRRFVAAPGTDAPRGSDEPGGQPGCAELYPFARPNPGVWSRRAAPALACLGVWAICQRRAHAPSSSSRRFPFRAPDNSPLCQRPEGGPAESTQYYAGASPGSRTLHFAYFMTQQGIAGSVCPKTLDETAIGYGYRPLLQALIVSLAPALN